MALQSLNIGTIANDGTGDNLRVGGDKINDNFSEIYTAFGDGSTLSSLAITGLNSATDTLTLSQSGLVSITGNSGTDTVDIGTASTAQIPFLKADGNSSDLDLQTSGKISEILSNLHIPFTKADGSDVTTLVVA